MRRDQRSLALKTEMTMKTLLKRCASCNIYTTKGFCPKCNEKTSGSAPPRYGPEDKYGDIRRQEMEEEENP